MGDKSIKRQPKNGGEIKPDLSRNARTHGINSMKRAMKELGNRAIDRRTRYGKALYAWRGQLIADLGGENTVTTAELQIVDTAIKTKLILDTVDAYISELGNKIINRRNRCLYPVVQQRAALADSLLRYLTALGLERKAAQVPSLAEYIEGKQQ